MSTYKRKEIIGDATLYLGDCREVLPSLQEESVDFVFTDPPYGHNNNNGDLIHNWEAALGRGKPGPARPIANDGIEANDLLREIFKEFNRLLVKGGCCCCCGGGGGPDPQFARWSLWLDESVGFKQMIVWDKGPIGMGWHYRRSYETILVGEKPGAKCRWFDESNAVENIIRPGFRGIRKIIPTADDHPTPKPIEMPSYFIQLHTREGDTVLDPFIGHGGCGVACANLNRKFIGIEIEEKYFDIACKHIERAQRQLKLFLREK